MLDMVERNFTLVYCWILSLMFAAFFSHELTMVKLDKYQRETEIYIDSLKRECNLKIAQAKNLN